MLVERLAEHKSLDLGERRPLKSPVDQRRVLRPTHGLPALRRRERAAREGPGARLVLHSANTFAESELPECFERNSEGPWPASVGACAALASRPP